MEKFELANLIETNQDTLNKLTKIINLEEINNEINKNNLLMQDPNFYSDLNKAQKIAKETEVLKKRLSKYQELTSEQKDLEELFSISDLTELAEIADDAITLSNEINKFNIELLLNDEYDQNSAIMEIHSGAGGTEAMDWVKILYRMYIRYCEKNNFKTKIISQVDGNEAGYKNISFEINGDLAYGYLKDERGVHRLVRISPFDANKRRHTSFASVMVYPKITNDNEIEIKKEDLKIDNYYSSGAGGQSVNTTMSAVRITHLPTGIVVSCQNERSQIQNKANAMNILKAKLIQLKIEEKEKALNKIKGDKAQIMWGSQRRSYVFCPYQLVKDHLTNYETSKLDMVLDGDINEFIFAELLDSKL